MIIQNIYTLLRILSAYRINLRTIRELKIQKAGKVACAVSMYSKLTFDNDTRKVEKALKKYEDKKTEALVLLAEIDLLEKMEDVKDAEMWKRKSMKEKLVAVERLRKDLKNQITDYIEKHGDQDLQRYNELLEELEKDKAHY